jgi:DNA-binding CsgD family transcriptional regulator
MPSIDYQTAFQLAPVGLVLSRARMIEDCNDEVCRIFGTTRDALIGQSFQVLYPTADEFERTGARIVPIMNAKGMYGRADHEARQRRAVLVPCHRPRAGPAGSAGAGIWTFEDLSQKRPVTAELTAREREIAAQLVEGKTSKQIGKLLAISPRTVDIYRARLMKKYGAHTAVDLVQRLVNH